MNVDILPALKDGEDVNKAITLNPRNARAYNNRGVSYKEIREYKESAAGAFRQGTIHRPGS